MAFSISFNYIIIVAGLYILLKIYNKLTTGVYKGNARLDGKTVVISGASSGLGMYCAKDFAKRGAKLILACPDLDVACKVKRDLVEKTGNSQIKIKYVDFLDLSSVRKCANEILSEESKIDILLNNAGIGRTNTKYTIDGLNPIIQVNYFAHFLFTNILLGKIKQSSPSRIVNVASLGHFLSDFSIDKIKDGGSQVNQFQQVIYGNSKLAIIYFTNYLAKLLKDTGVTVNCLHPGTIGTDIARNAPYYQQLIWKFVARSFFKTLDEGAQTSIYLCLSPDVANISGKYFSDCALARTSKISKDIKIAEKLWNVTEDIVDLQISEKHY